MSKILYRMDPFKELPPEGYEVVKADRPIPF
ncbi:hypothetical protein IACHDJAJ_00022 [Aeromonas phage vB_AdhS_TS3]|nr:hypothetical protein IACHDJAJ_00022 [Aeromonas phage vB_AdhS_TS3]